MKSEAFDAQLERFDSDLWHFHIVIPSLIAQPFLSAGEKRVMCQLADSPPFACALMPRGDGQYFININKERRKKLGLELGQSIAAQIWKDESTYGLPMPEELGTLLEMDNEFNTFFHTLTPGKQRNLIHLVNTPKRSETRLRKAVTICDYLKGAQGKLDFKALNQAFKNAPR